MKRILPFVFLFALSAAAQVLPINQGTTWLFNSSSYSTPPDLWGAMFATYPALNDPSKTNRFGDWSRGGSSWLGDYQNQQYKWTVPFLANAPADTKNFVGANDNGGGVSNNVVVWGPLIASATNSLYSNGGIVHDFSFPNLSTVFIGENPHDSTGGDGGSLSRDAGSDYLTTIYGTPKIHEWITLSNAGWIGNITYATGSHPSQGGLLGRTITTLIALGAETNVGSWIVDYSAVTFTTDHCVASGISKVGTVITSTLHYDRAPFGWPVPDGTITNDARECFFAMPSLGNSFRWMIQGTNFPAGIISVAVDGETVGTYSTATFQSGVNWFTNYVGPLWRQRLAVYKKVLDMYGVDYVTFANAHTAGSPGVLGVGDYVNYISDANGAFDGSGLRGSAYVTAMATDMSHLDMYFAAIHTAAQQTDHTLTITFTQLATLSDWTL